MLRLSGFAIAIFLVVGCGNIYAQQTLEVKNEYGTRHAKIPQSPSDTGFLYDEHALEGASQDYWNSARFSGDNAGKSMYQLEKESFKAINAMQNQVAFKSLSNPAWVPIAGSQDGHASGRIKAIAFDATNSKVVYIGAASGGIWKTNDITANPVSWINLADRLPTVNFGALAVDPKRPNIVYAGTGEVQGDNYREQLSGSSSAGSGLFKSVDGGLNWDTIATTATTAEGSYCAQIVIDPVNTDTLYVATGSTWILKSYDGGVTMKKVAVGVSTYDIAIDPLNTSNLYTSGIGSIYRSVDRGETWIKCVTGLPSSPSGRFSIAVSPSEPNIIYASIGTVVNSLVRPMLGMWVSIDYGVTWSKMMQYNPSNPATATNANPLGNQQEYGNAIVVHPTNSKRVFVGGLDIYLSNDTGKSYSQLSYWTQAKTNASFVHADIHILAFNGTTLFACTDGGLAMTQTPFTAWNTTINKGIATLQFVGVDADKDFTYVTGGCQDNSTNHALIGDADFHETIGGDGGHAWVSHDQSNIAYTTYVNSNFKQSTDGGLTWSSNLITAGSGLASENSPFYTVYDCSTDGTIIALGGNSHVWVSTSGGTDAFPNKSNVTIANSFAVHVSQLDPTYMWAGSSGNIFHSNDQGTTWVKQTSAVSSTVTGITSDPTNASNVFACTTSGKHFFKSTDGGVTYTSPATNLPNIPCWSIAYNPRDGKLFIGTEKGVLFSVDGGTTWFPLMNGMPNAMVTQLRVRGTNNDKLLAGTYGRGMFWLDISNLASVNSTSTTLPLSLDPVIPNPVTSTNAAVGFSLHDGGLATITLHDILGRELRILEKNYYEAGKHQISFTKENLTAGTYFIMLTANGRSVSQKVVIE
jgi:hypothetical protein